MFFSPSRRLLRPVLAGASARGLRARGLCSFSTRDEELGVLQKLALQVGDLRLAEDVVAGRRELHGNRHPSTL